MSAVNPSVADWLEADALYATATDPAAADWGDSATESEIISPLALKADALAEAARQLGFQGGPLTIDEHIVLGRQIALIGTAQTLTGDRLGYESGGAVFVIGAVENADGTTTLTVLRRL